MASRHGIELYWLAKRKLALRLQLVFVSPQCANGKPIS